jgi:hypothetical protein
VEDQRPVSARTLGRDLPGNEDAAQGQHHTASAA